MQKYAAKTKSQNLQKYGAKTRKYANMQKYAAKTKSQNLQKYGAKTRKYEKKPCLTAGQDRKGLTLVVVACNLKLSFLLSFLQISMLQAP